MCAYPWRMGEQRPTPSEDGFEARRFPAAALAGVAGRVLLVACALACALLLLDALFGGLTWALTRDRGALADAAAYLAAAMAVLAVAAAGGCARERLRWALETERARRLVEAGPWGAAS